MRLIRFGGHIEVALLQEFEIVSIELQWVSLETFGVLWKGVGKTMGYRLSSCLTSRLAVTHQSIIEDFLTT